MSLQQVAKVVETELVDSTKPSVIDRRKFPEGLPDSSNLVVKNNSRLAAKRSPKPQELRQSAL